MVEAVLMAADPAAYEFHLIGDVEDSFPEAARRRLRLTGRYKDADLPRLLRKVAPQVLWFPASWPETYSYTVSAGVEAGLPIVASRIGALTERLTGRPLTWMVDSGLETAPWLDAFEAARAALAEAPPTAPMRDAIPDFYAGPYLAAPAIRRSGTIDLRRPGRTSVVVVPERFDNGALTPCAYIRLLLPLDHAAGRGDLDIVLADAETATRYRADIVATQRYAVPDAEAADALAAHVRMVGARLFYDLDDDLLNIPRDHPDAKALRPKAKTVQRMLRRADRLFVSTAVLAGSLRSLRDDAVVVPNALDERLWGQSPPPRRAGPHHGPVRLLCMGTATHDADFATIEPALARLVAAFGGRVQIDMIGFSSQRVLPWWVRRLGLPPTAHASYPGFVHWISTQPLWDIGLVPLNDSAFNRCKSPIKTLDYAALGLALVTSDVAVYRGSLADGTGGMLVSNTEDAWYTALCRLVRDTELRRRLGQGAWEGYMAVGTLAAQSDEWRAAWLAGTDRSLA